MNALVIGAGAIGQVFGHYLQNGGSRVTFFARRERAQRIKNGLVLYHLNRRNSRRRPIHFESFEVFSEYLGIEDQEWDQVYFCIPSDALSENLLEQVSRRSGEATIIKLQPGLGDRRIYMRHFEESWLVSGMISFMSYAAPLPKEKVVRPGIAYWLPPLLSTPFSGSKKRVKAVVKALNDGGLRARVHGDCFQNPSIRSAKDHESIELFIYPAGLVLRAAAVPIQHGAIPRGALQEAT